MSDIDLSFFENLPPAESAPEPPEPEEETPETEPELPGPPEQPIPPKDPDGLSCEVCGAPLVWSGRGRKPKYCIDHKSRTSANARSSDGGARRSSKATNRIAQLESDLFKELAIFGKGVSKVLPTTGVTLVKRAETTSKALARIAQDNPKLLEVLELSTKVVPGLELGETAAAVALALLVDMGRVQPDALLPSMFGVSETWHELNDEEDLTQDRRAYVEAQQAESAPQSIFTVGVPPRFEKVAA